MKVTSRTYTARFGRLLVALLLCCGLAAQSPDTDTTVETATQSDATEAVAPAPEDTAADAETVDTPVEDAEANPDAEEKAPTGAQTSTLPPVAPIEADGLDDVNALLRPPGTTENSTEDTRPDRENASGFSPYLQGIAALCILCGAIILLGWLARKIGGHTPLLAGQQFGKVLGRVSLSPRAALHYVQSADRILVVGVTQTSINLITEFPREAFEAPPKHSTPNQALRAPDFLAHLQDATHTTPNTADEDDDMDVLRGDLQRLQQYLRQRGGQDD